MPILRKSMEKIIYSKKLKQSREIWTFASPKSKNFQVKIDGKTGFKTEPPVNNKLVSSLFLSFRLEAEATCYDYYYRNNALVDEEEFFFTVKYVAKYIMESTFASSV